MHTPAPWNIVRSLTCGHLRAAHNYNADPRQEFTDADITLMEAAPYLLAACYAALTLAAVSSNREKVFRQIRDAISIATQPTKEPTTCDQ